MLHWMMPSQLGFLSMNKNTKLSVSLWCFHITFFLGYIFRILTFGWLMFILMIPEYFVRTFYYFVGIYIIKKDADSDRYKRGWILQGLYLVTSFFSFDGGDMNSYTFAHLWINPPDYIPYLWMLFALIFIVTLIGYTLSILSQKQTENQHKRSSIVKSLLYCINGIVLTPVLAFMVMFWLSKYFHF